MSSETFEKLKQAVIGGDEEKAAEYAQEAMDEGLDPVEAIEKGLVAGVAETGDRWIREEVFLTEVMLSANAMDSGLKILKKEMKKQGKTRKFLGKVLLGTVQGDIHDLGKNIVAALLSAAGFDVHDLGIDIKAEKFIESVKEEKPDVLALSSLMTITIPEQRAVIEALTITGLREKIKVIVGGAPVTAEWAEEIGADGYGRDAIDAVKKVKELLGV